MSRGRPTDPLVAATVGSARLEGLDVPVDDIVLAEAYAAGEIDADEYLAEVRRCVAEDVPAPQA